MKRKGLDRFVVAADLRPQIIESMGNLMIGLVRDREHNDRMKPVLKLTDRGGEMFIIELSPVELRAVLDDALNLISADQRTVSRWFAALSGDAESDGKPTSLGA